MNGYELSRNWFNWCFENTEKISPNHTALYFFCIEHCNRMGWKEKFGLPTTMAKEAIGIKSYNTYKKTLDDLVSWGFIIMHEYSKNQYSSNIVALLKFDKALNKALDKAIVKHLTTQSESTGESNSSIDKQDNNKPKTKNELTKDEEDIFEYFKAVTKKGIRTFEKKARVSLKKRLENFEIDDIKKAILNCYNDEYHVSQNHKHLTLEFILREDKLNKFLSITPKQTNGFQKQTSLY